MKAVTFTVALFFASLASWAQSPIVTPNAVDLHITQETSRDQLAQMQQSLHAAGIGFRYDLVAWEGNGFALLIKRLDKNRFQWPASLPLSVVELNTQQIDWLLAGYNLTVMQGHDVLPHHRVL